MIYNGPTGEAADASYSDGSSSVEGSIVPGVAIEHDQREIVNAITASGQTPSASNLTQLANAITIGAQLKVDFLGVATALNASHRDKQLLCNGVSPFTVTLPVASATPVGYVARIRNVFLTAITVASAGGLLQLPKGVTRSTLVLPQSGDGLVVVNDGTAWQVLDYNVIPFVQARMSANQSGFVNNTYGKVAFDSTTSLRLSGDFDTATDRAICSIPGLYIVRGQVKFLAMPAASEIEVQVRLNGGVAAECFGFVSGNATKDLTVPFTAFPQTSLATDYLEVWARQISGGSRVIDSVSSQFDVVRF